MAQDARIRIRQKALRTRKNTGRAFAAVLVWGRLSSAPDENPRNVQTTGALDSLPQTRTAGAQRRALRAGKSPAHGFYPCPSVFFRVLLCVWTRNP